MSMNGQRIAIQYRDDERRARNGGPIVRNKPPPGCDSKNCPERVMRPARIAMLDVAAPALPGAVDTGRVQYARDRLMIGLHGVATRSNLQGAPRHGRARQIS